MPQARQAAAKPDDAPAPDVTAPAPDSQPAAARDTSGRYVLLVAEVDEPLEFKLHVDDAQEPILFSGGQEDAKRAAIKDSQELRDKVASDGVILAAVPLASWKPTTAKLRPRDPVLDLG